MLPTRKNLCQCPAGNWTTWRPPDDRKETQTAVVLSCLPFIRSGQNHLARHSERGEKTRQREEEVGRQHQRMDRPGVRQVPEGSGKQGKMEKTGCEIICGAPTTLAVKGWMMMMMNITLKWLISHLVQCPLQMIAYQWHDIFHCGPLAAGRDMERYGKDLVHGWDLQQQHDSNTSVHPSQLLNHSCLFLPSMFILAIKVSLLLKSLLLSII